ncbi:MAG: 2Fe-2S iron-sulfur cluster-binding protein, partial [Clostridia bacterium]|nr:2Fe-2S iron-sulfur cluster-binding protein [Clostridia bacterium]
MFDSLKITVITPTQRQIIEVPKGENLLRALGANQIFIPAPCGGRGICNKCKVRLLEGQVDVPITDGCFNACAYTIKNDITIAVDNTTQKAFHATVERGDFTIKKQKGYGVAIDIGTTSLAAYLADLESGKILDSIGELNRQGSFGADVLSRISFSKDHLPLLTHTIHTQIDGIKEMFCKKHGISAIEKTVICGNNTMLHLLCGVSPLSMGESPFTPVFTDTQYRKDYITLPSASAYIGSDIIAGVLSCGMADNPNNSLLIDIGTNGEMV